MGSFRQMGWSVHCQYGDNVRLIGASPDKEFGLQLGMPHNELDLGPYSGPPLTVTPVILSDGNSIDLTLQVTVFWALG